MLTTRVRLKLLVFMIISVVIVVVTSVYYIRLPQLLGLEQYTVTAHFSDASGIYSNAIVTYRGEDVGRVGSVNLEPQGTSVQLHINDGINIPADSIASIHSTSAIGEQYVDLVPTAGSNQYPVLHDGSVIDQADTRVLPSTDALITALNKLVATLPKQTIANTLDDLSTALAGTGPSLQRLLDSATELLDSARQNVGPTTNLLNDLGPFLQTQQDLSAQTTSTVTDLRSFTHQLVLSNSDIVTLLQETPQLATQVTGVVKDLSPTLTVLLTNLTGTGKVLDVYDPAVREVLSVYPALLSGLIAFAQGAVRQTGLIPLSFHLNIDSPPACITGFLPPSQRRDPSVTTSIPTPSGLYCKQPAAAPPSVRGTRNLPCLNNPGVRAATPADCLGLSVAAAERLYDTGSAAADGPGDNPGTTTPTAAGQPNDILAMLASVADSSDKETTWQDLLLGPTRT